MASEELNKMTVITDLSNQAIQEYEGLQRKHDTTTMECKRLEEERDEAIKKLNEFHQVSQMVIEEVSAIQENLEIERMCRGSAEALASKLQRQNVCLKRQSMLLLSQLGPQTLTEISLDQEEDTTDICSSTLCQNNIQELQSQLELTLKEKNQAVTDLETAREQLSETREELLREKDNNTAMIAETVRQRKILGKYNRVSQFAVEEFEALQDALNLETDLRTEAEKFARVMLLEQKQLKRQSHILMQSSSPGPALQEALSQVSALTQELEALRLQHHSQMEQTESRLGSSEDQSQLKALTIKLELLEEEKDQYSHQWSKAQVDIKDLRYTVEELQKKLQTATNPPPAPAPPPPPPPPPLPAPSPPASNPLSSLLSLIRKRRDISGDIPLVAQDSGQTPELDVRQQAVDEMMQRIKKGVQLRPVGQSPNRRQVERRPSNSAYQELKGIMESFNRASPQPKTVSPATSRDEELRSILLRRRGALDS